MSEFLSDKLRDFAGNLKIKGHAGLMMDAEQTGELIRLVEQWRQMACEQENEISRLTWNLDVRTDAFTAVCANLDRAEALLRNNDPLYQISNDILDEVDHPGSNVCLMIRPSGSKFDGGAGVGSNATNGGKNDGGDAA